MFWLYVFFALFFAAVLVGVGIYETRRADRKLLNLLEDSGTLRRHQQKAARVSR